MTDSKPTKMKTIIRFKLWDSKEKVYMMQTPHDELSFLNYEMADEYRSNYLQKGNYMDLPFNNIHIHKFINDQFISNEI